MGTGELPRFDVRGQTALVTGAARGIGRACALALAQAGADVALGLRDVRTGGPLAKEIESLGRRALPLQMDMTRLPEVRAAVEAAAAHFGRLDILVNNAGIAPEKPAEDVREEDFDLTLAVNLKGTFFASQAAGRVMIRQKYGRTAVGGLLALVFGVLAWHRMERLYASEARDSGREAGRS
jgi:NAD(P)-dependent dehydrogenase (short-subunit alcohol dehydrogenase family)